MCECASMRPGSSVVPGRSMTFAPAGAFTSAAGADGGDRVAGHEHRPSPRAASAVRRRTRARASGARWLARPPGPATARARAIAAATAKSAMKASRFMGTTSFHRQSNAPPGGGRQTRAATPRAGSRRHRRDRRRRAARPAGPLPARRRHRCGRCRRSESWLRRSACERSRAISKMRGSGFSTPSSCESRTRSTCGSRPVRLRIRRTRAVRIRHNDEPAARRTQPRQRADGAGRDHVPRPFPSLNDTTSSIASAGRHSAGCPPARGSGRNRRSRAGRRPSPEQSGASSSSCFTYGSAAARTSTGDGDTAARQRLGQAREVRRDHHAAGVEEHRAYSAVFGMVQAK